MPLDWQDKLAASGIQYDHLNELNLYFSRLEKNEKSRTHEKTARHGTSHSHRNQRKEPYKSQPRDDKRKDRGSNQAKQERWCNFHKTGLHNTADCHALKNKNKGEYKRAELKLATQQQNKDNHESTKLWSRTQTTTTKNHTHVSIVLWSQSPTTIVILQATNMKLSCWSFRQEDSTN